MNQYRMRHKKNVKELAEAYKEGIVQRITRNLLDIQMLRLIQTQPMWGYMIKKQAETRFGVKLRHGALYPLLNALERESFLTSQNQRQGGRTRKVYTLTRKGQQYIEAYNSVLKEQLERRDMK
ncbi:MAG: PadR family transcriptional regulator [Candidatus Bathyarchaeia archaeon]|jgi:DNA-binding PadR family transcriptional regulator